MSTKQYKRHIISVAKQLGYKENVIARLEAAASENEITRIMNMARRQII
ncbi:Uncharacterised protein [uncultured Clostridium sp.]|nr:Uncharacterised protein [uncultured Clostridium sp.]